MMRHGEIIQDGVVIVKPDARLKRSARSALQFIGRIGKSAPNLRSLLRQEQLLHWFHHEIHGLAVRGKYRGKRVYLAMDERLLAGLEDFRSIVREQAKHFPAISDLEDGLRRAFSLIRQERISSEQRRKMKKQVQTYGEPWQHRSR